MVDKTALGSYISSGSFATFGGFTSNDIAAFGGLAFVALTYATNLYFKVKADRRREKAEKEKAA